MRTKQDDPDYYDGEVEALSLVAKECSSPTLKVPRSCMLVSPAGVRDLTLKGVPVTSNGTKVSKANEVGAVSSNAIRFVE